MANDFGTIHGGHPPDPGGDLAPANRNGHDGHPGHDVAPRNGEAPPARREPREVIVPAGEAADDGPGIDIAAILLRRKWWIIVCTLLGLAGGYWALSQAVPMYRSFARLAVRSSSPSIMGESGLDAGGQYYLNTEMQVLQGTNLLGDVFNRPGIADLPSLRDLDSPGAKIGALAGMRGVSALPNSEILEVSATSPSPDEAQTVVREIVNAYQLRTARSSESNAARVMEVIRREKQEAQKELDEIWSQIERLSRSQGTLPDDLRRGNLSTARLGELQEALTKVDLELLEDQMDVQAVEAAEGDDGMLRALLPEATAGNSELWAQHAAMRRNLAEMSFTYGDNAAQVEQARNRVNLLGKELEALDAQALGNAVEATKRKLQLTRRKRDELLASYNQQREEAIDENATSISMARLQSEREAHERFLAVADERLRQLDVNQESVSFRVTVMEDAKPGYQVAPNPPQLLGMGLVLGLMGGFGLAFVMEWADPRLRDADEVEGLLGVSVLGAVPTIEKRQSPQERALHAVRVPGSQASEALRDLRTVLFYHLPKLSREGRGGRAAGQVLLVTSPLPGEGKTTTACNVAAVLAESGRRTLLLDAECRRPSVAKYLGLNANNTPAAGGGLSGLLCGGADPAAGLDAALVAGPAHGGPDALDVLPCGDAPANPSEMLDSDAFDELLAELRRRYDAVVIDSPPVLPVTDARVLSKHADGVIFVLRAMVTSKRSAVHAREALARVGAPLLGVVVNDVTYRKQRFGRGYYGGGKGYHSYRYAYAAKDEDGRELPRFVASRSLDRPRPAEEPSGTNGQNGHA